MNEGKKDKTEEAKRSSQVSTRAENMTAQLSLGRQKINKAGTNVAWQQWNRFIEYTTPQSLYYRAKQEYLARKLAGAALDNNVNLRSSATATEQNKTIEVGQGRYEISADKNHEKAETKQAQRTKAQRRKDQTSRTEKKSSRRETSISAIGHLMGSTSQMAQILLKGGSQSEQQRNFIMEMTKQSAATATKPTETMKSTAMPWREAKQEMRMISEIAERGAQSSLRNLSAEEVLPEAHSKMTSTTLAQTKEFLRQSEKALAITGINTRSSQWKMEQQGQAAILRTMDVEKLSTAVQARAEERGVNRKQTQVVAEGAKAAKALRTDEIADIARWKKTPDGYAAPEQVAVLSQQKINGSVEKLRWLGIAKNDPNFWRRDVVMGTAQAYPIMQQKKQAEKVTLIRQGKSAAEGSHFSLQDKTFIQGQRKEPPSITLRHSMDGTNKEQTIQQSMDPDLLSDQLGRRLLEEIEHSASGAHRF